MHKIILHFSILLGLLCPVFASAQSQALPAGWSMVGNDTGAAINADAVFGNASAPTAISPSVTTVWTWNNAQSQWNFFSPSMSTQQLSTYAASKGYGVLSSIAKGEGFWVNAKNQFMYDPSVTAVLTNVAPVANAGVAQHVVAGSVVTLDGSASSDANGDTLTYAWALTSKPAGSSAALSSATSAKPTFTVDVAGIYIGTLTVNDGKINSAGAMVTVTAGTGITPLPVGSGSYVIAVGKEVYKLDASSGVITIQPSACQNYIAADVTPEGRVIALYNLYTFAAGYNYESKVAEINILTGACNDLFTLPVSGMRGIAVAPDGTIVTVGNGRVYRFTAAGAQLGQAHISGQSNIAVSGISSLTDVDAIDFAPDGTLYATKLSSVWQLDPLSGIGIFQAFAIAGFGDIDIDNAGVLRTLYNEDLQLYSTADWRLISSKTQNNGITSFFGSALVHR